MVQSTLSVFLDIDLVLYLFNIKFITYSLINSLRWYLFLMVLFHQLLHLYFRCFLRIYFCFNIFIYTVFHWWAFSRHYSCFQLFSILLSSEVLLLLVFFGIFMWLIMFLCYYHIWHSDVHSQWYFCAVDLNSLYTPYSFPLKRHQHLRRLLHLKYSYT